jgi:glyoxylate reductase
MTARPVILVSRKLPPAVTERLTRHFEARLNPEDRLLDEAALLAGTAGADGLLVCPTDKLTAAVIGRLPDSVRIISTFSVGYDHIDLAAAKARGLVVTNTPDVLTDATADIAMLLLLAAARRAHEGERMLRDNRWGAWAPTGMLGTHLGGKRLGIYGMGRIGRAVARRARAFDMEIHYHDLARLPPEREQGAAFHDTPEKLLAVSQFLSLHCPATPETRRFLDRRRIALLPDGAIVVNTARGTIVDDDALIEALGSGRLAAAGLDVYENEPAIDPRYRTIENCFLLPHLGSATVETRDAMGFKCLDSLESFFARRPVPDRVV